MAKSLPLPLLTLLLPASSRRTATYDAGGLPLSVADPGGKTTVNQRDALGRLAQTTAPTGAVTKFAYDGMSESALKQDRRGDWRRASVAWVVAKETSMPHAWIAEKLNLKSAANASQQIQG